MSCGVTVNLIPADRLLKRQKRRRLHRWSVALAAYGGCLLAVCGGVQSRWGADDAAMASELDQTDRRISELNARLGDMRRRIGEIESTRQTTLSIIDQPDWSILLALLGRAGGPEVVLREIELRPMPAGAAKGNALKLRGLALSQPVVSQFVLRLQEVGLFDEVKLDRTGREPIFNTSAISFDISCAIREGGGATP